MALLVVLAAASLRAEDGYELWLRYRPEPDAARRAEYATFAAGAITAATRPVLAAARSELARAVPAILAGATDAKSGGIFLGLRADHPALAALVSAGELAPLGDEGFVLRAGEWHGRPALAVVGNTDRGVLHGVFALLRRLQLGEPLAGLQFADAPRVAVRMANHWDNPVRTTGFRGESIEYRVADLGVPRGDEPVRDGADRRAAVPVRHAALHRLDQRRGGRLRERRGEQILPAREEQRAIVELDREQVARCEMRAGCEVVAQLARARADVVTAVAEQCERLAADRALVAGPEPVRWRIGDTRHHVGIEPAVPAGAGLRRIDRQRCVIAADALRNTAGDRPFDTTGGVADDDVLRRYAAEVRDGDRLVDVVGLRHRA